MYYRKNKKKLYILCLISLLMIIGIGYALLFADLKINGDALFREISWDIHFGTPTVTNGSVSGENVITAVNVTGTSSDTIEYSVILAKPRDFYEFVVPVINNSSVDAMVDSVTNKIYSGNEEIEKPDYVGYKVLYENGAVVREKQLIPLNSTQNIKVKVFYKDNGESPNADSALSFKFTINFVQAENNAVEIVAPKFNEESSWEEVIEGIREGSLIPHVGDVKTIILGSYGSHILRVANVSTPDECATEGFSQTACGLVLEFADVITTRNMNSSSTNIGGWPATSMRTFVNTDIYNLIPSVVREAIIDTRVVSGHGSSSGELNFVSTDKLYLFSGKEVGFNNNYDTVNTETRVLDYYNVNNNNSARIKSKDEWWLRSAYSNSTNYFNFVDYDGTNGYHIYASTSPGVAPAFRIK